MNVEWSPRASADVAALDRSVRRRVLAAIDLLAETRQGSVIKLQGRESRWRMRVGDWRVILAFDYTNNTLEVLRVLHRGEAYR